MPFITRGNTRLYYRLEGSSHLPVLILSHSLGCDHGMWALQMPDLLEHFQVLRYDTRGHGASDAPAGDYSMEQLGNDVLGLAHELGIPHFAFCGISMGGAIGEWLAIHSPMSITALVLANSSAQFASDILETRRQDVLRNGVASVVDTAMQRFFTPETLAHPGPCVQSIRSVFLGTNPLGYAGCCAALRDVNHKPDLLKIAAPSLIIVGERDLSTPWNGHGEILARGISGATLMRLDTAHLSNLEQPKAFTAAVLSFLQRSHADSRRTMAG